MQLFTMADVMLLMIVLFFSNQALRPYTFVISGAVLALTGWTNGHTTAILLKVFGAQDWLGSAWLSSCVFPAWMIFSLSVIDVIEWDTESSDTTPYSYALAMACAWLLLTVPVSMHGAYIGFTKSTDERPKVNVVKRTIPQQPWFTNAWLTVPVFSGIIFASVYIEFSYFIDSMWHSYTMYAMFGFLLINLCLMAIIAGLLSVI